MDLKEERVFETESTIFLLKFLSISCFFILFFKHSQNNNFTSEAWLCFRKSGLVRLFFISVRLARIPDKCSRILGAQRLLAQELSELCEKHNHGRPSINV